jgi:triosephosphate isomerase
MRKTFIAGNWKMNLTNSAASELATALVAKLEAQSDVDVAICPSFGFLAGVAAKLVSSQISLGAQNLYPADSGAYTGELNAEMLLDLGCEYVILGHSERRHLPHLSESDAFINQKLKSALKAGLKPILCVGELLEERETGRTTEVVEEQLTNSLTDITTEQFDSVTIAYEPVWAIGTGKVATPDQAEEVHGNIREWLSSRFNAHTANTTRIQYGGSVKPENARELLSQPNIDGALVGGAALSVESFTGIISNA